MLSDPTGSFQRIRPFCVKLARKPSVEATRELENALKLIESDDLSHMVDYIIFPLKLIIQTPSQAQDLKQAAVDCICTLLARGKVTKRETFEDTFTQLCVLLSRKDPQKHAELSEELISSILCCITELFNCSTLIVKSSLYCPRFLPALGHCVSLLLSIAEHEKSKVLKISAVNCLRRIALCNMDATTLLLQTEAEELVNAVRTSCSEAFASFIPGISMSLCRLLSNDSLQKHSVLFTALDTWGDILVLVLNDDFYPCISDTDTVTQKMANLSGLGETTNNKNYNHLKQDEQCYAESNGVIDREKSLVTYRDKAWFDKTSTNMKVLIDKAVAIANHPNWKIRLAVVQFAKKLLFNCTKSMQNCMASLVNVLVTLTTDEFEEVSSVAKSVLKQFSQCNLSDGLNSLKSMMQEYLHSLLSELPRLIRTSGDEKKLQNFSLINGYLSILGSNVCGVLNSVSHLKRLSLALVQVLEFDLSDVGIVEERTLFSMDTGIHLPRSGLSGPLIHSAKLPHKSIYPKYRFKHFSNDKIYSLVVRICQLLGHYGNLSLLVDHFLDLFHESVTHQKQAVFILNEVIRGYSGLSSDTQLSLFADSTVEVNGAMPNRQDLSELESVAQLLLSVYLSSNTWNIPTSNRPGNVISQSVSLAKELAVLQDHTKNNQSEKCLSFETLNSNIHLSCLLLESVGVLASSLGVNFEPFLIQSIYPVMARLANENAAVNQSAYATLVHITQSCNYQSVEELICHNSDYLVNAIAVNFKFVFMNEQAPKVLRVMIQYGNADILPIIEDTLMDLFAVIDTYSDQLIYALMTVLNTLLHAIKRWFPVEKSMVELVDSGLRQQLGVKKGTEVNDTEQIEKSSPEEICQYFVDYHKSKQMAMGEMKFDSCEMDESVAELPGDDVTEDFEQDKKPEVPLHLKYVKEVLEKCIHFLSSKSAWLRLLVLDNVETGVLSLQQSQNELLPMIHRLWPPLVRRFTDSEQVVASKAVAVLCTMAEVSGDFMKRRVIKDALPPLCTFLSQQSPVSLKAGPVYTHSQAYKLQLIIIEGLGQLSVQLGFAAADLSQITETCLPYLSVRQPPRLQQIAIKSFEKFIKLEPDAMWLILNDLYCPGDVIPPHRVFRQVILGGCGSDHKEFEKNVEFLLKRLQEQSNVCS